LQRKPMGIHHLLINGGVPTEVPEGSHPKTLHYLLRAVDATVVDGTRNLGVYVKLLRSMVYAPISPANPAGWAGTRIYAGGGTMKHQNLSMQSFGAFVQMRVGLLHETPLTDKVVNMISKSLKKDPERALNSESFAVHRASQDLWDSE
jgi:hypothetical protein